MTVDEKALEAVEQAVERELDVVEMVDTSRSALRKMRSKRIARAAILVYEAAKPVPASGGVEAALTIDALAQEIRRVDGNHSLGAGALAEAILPFISVAVARAMQNEERADG